MVCQNGNMGGLIAFSERFYLSLRGKKYFDATQSYFDAIGNAGVVQPRVAVKPAPIARRGNS
jgi:hypothetical protein